MTRLKDKTLILNRLKEAYNLNSNADLSRFLGVTPSVINNWYSRNTIDYDLIITKCVDINFNWLLSGKGEMFIIDNTQSIINEIGVRVVGRHSYVNYVQHYSDPNFLETLPFVPLMLNMPPLKCIAFEVSGDSMNDNQQDSLSVSDVIMGVKILFSDAFIVIKVNTIVIINHKEQGILIRYIKEVNRSDKTIVLGAKSPLYDDIIISEDDVVELFVGRMVLRHLDA